MSTDPYASPTDKEWERMIEWERDLEAEPARVVLRRSRLALLLPRMPVAAR